MTGVAGASYFRRMEQRVIVSKLENVGQGRERRESSHGRHEPYNGTKKKQRVALQLTSQKSALNWTRTPRNRLRRTRPDFFENQALRSSLPPPNSKPTFLQPGIRLEPRTGDPRSRRSEPTKTICPLSGQKGQHDREDTRDHERHS